MHSNSCSNIIECRRDRTHNRHHPNIIIPPTQSCPSRKVTVNSGIISLNPDQGPITAGNLIIINGFNLVRTLSVTMNNIPIPFKLLSNNQLEITALSEHVIKAVNITVIFHGGYSESLLYTYTDNIYIISLDPASGPITGSNIITINGNNISSAVSIYFNEIITYNFIVLSDTSLQVAVPNLTGQHNVLIYLITGNGSSNSLSYDLIPPPII